MLRTPSRPPSLHRSTGVIAFATVISRILGLVRDQVLGGLFPVGITDPFFAAFRIPNTLRRLFAEGALSSAFIPVFVRSLEHDERPETNRFASSLFRFLFLALGVLSVSGVLFAPAIIRVVAPGLAPGEESLAVSLTRVMFPYILLIGLAALTMGMLNSLHRFFMPAVSSAFLNISIIGAAVLPLCLPNASPAIHWVAWGVILGGLLQFVSQWMVLRRELRIEPWGRELIHPHTIAVGRLFLPAVIGQAVVQINILIDTFFASFVPGAITYLYFANRLMQFPLGVYGIAVATASFPTLAGHFTREDRASFSGTFNRAARSVFFILCPATFALLFFGRDIVALLFHHGEFRSGGSLEPTTAALFAYAGGLTVFAMVKLTATAIHATGNTRGPMWAGVAAVVLNVFLDWLLVQTPLKHVGLALATVVAGVLNLSLLLILLRGSLSKGMERAAFPVLLRSAALGLVAMGGGLLLASWILPWDDPRDPATMRAGLRLLLGFIAGGVLYFAGAFKVLEPELRALLGAFGRKKGS